MNRKLEIIPLDKLTMTGGAGGANVCTVDNPSGARPQQYVSQGPRPGSRIPGVSGDGSRYPRSRQQRYSDLARRTMRNMARR